MEHLQNLCLSSVLDRSLLIARNLIGSHVKFEPHDKLPMHLAVGFRRAPYMSEEDMDTYAFLSTTGASIPKDLQDRYLGYSVEALRGWDETDWAGRMGLASAHDIGAVAELYSCQYDDLVLLDVMFRDDVKHCIHTELPFSEVTGLQAPARRMYLRRPWQRLSIEDSILRHPLLPRRTVRRMTTEGLWPSPF